MGFFVGGSLFGILDVSLILVFGFIGFAERIANDKSWTKKNIMRCCCGRRT